jgi:hypothetical protein
MAGLLIIQPNLSNGKTIKMDVSLVEKQSILRLHW